MTGSGLLCCSPSDHDWPPARTREDVPGACARAGAELTIGRKEGARGLRSWLVPLTGVEPSLA